MTTPSRATPLTDAAQAATIRGETYCINTTGLTLYPAPPEGMERSPHDGSWPDGRSYTNPTVAAERCMETYTADPRAGTHERVPPGIDRTQLPSPVSGPELDRLMLAIGRPRQTARHALFELYDMPDGSCVAWMFVTGAPHWMFFEDRREFRSSVSALVNWVAGDLGPWRFGRWVKRPRSGARLRQRVGT